MNEVVKKHIIDDLYSYSISYDAGSDCGPMSGMRLTGGRPIVNNGVKAVQFEQKIKGQSLAVKYEARPELAALVAEYEAIEAQRAADREAKRAAQQAAQDAIDNPLLEAMRAEAAALRAKIPASHVLVMVEQTGDLDGDPILEYRVDGVKLNWRDVEVVGVAAAIRPGAMGAFAIERICSISIDKFEQIKAAQQTAAEASKIAKEAREKELKETEIPPEATRAYRHYHGNADKAWEDSNETAWALIEKWTPYIETQRGMDAVKLQREVTEAAREANYGINEG